MISTNVLFFVFVTVVFNRDFGSSHPSTNQKNAGGCVVQQICHDRPSPQEFTELVSLVKEMGKKLDVMEAKLDAVCSGECPSKRVPRNCAEVYKSGNKTSGVYTIRPDDGDAFDVYCDHSTSGGGWTVFQKRLNGAVDFYRGWDNYKKGFGLMDGEFWLGLDKIHRLTNQTVNELRVDLEDFNLAKAYAGYDLFKVENESKNYELNLGAYSGTAGDSLSKGNGMAFSTKDRDNDVWGKDCAGEHRAAWWYRTCHDSNLNGIYFQGHYTGRVNNAYAHGCVWKTWRGYYYSLKTVTMKIRPTCF